MKIFDHFVRSSFVMSGNDVGREGLAWEGLVDSLLRRLENDLAVSCFRVGKLYIKLSGSHFQGQALISIHSKGVVLV